MAIGSYSDLQAAVANYLARPGDAVVATAAADLVALAESRIAYGGDEPFASRGLRLRAMETSATLILPAAQSGGMSGGSADAQTVSLATAPTLAPGLTIAFTAGFANDGPATLNANGTGPVAIKKAVPPTDLAAGDLVAGGPYQVYYDASVYNLVPAGGMPLPGGFLEMRSLVIASQPTRRLLPVTPETYAASRLSLGTGEPVAFCLEGDAIRFGPAPDAAYVGRMNYYRKFPALAGSASGTNWLLANKPDVYLYGALLEAAIYLGQEQDMQRFFGLYRAAAEGLANANARDRLGGGPLQMIPLAIGA